MGLKKLFNKICVLGAFAAFVLPNSAPLALAQAEAPLDIAKINQAIATVLAPLVAENPEIDSIGLELDAANTDLNRDRLGMRLTTGLKQTSWSSDPTRFATDLVLQANRRSQSGRDIVDVELQAGITVDTPSVAMLVYTAGIARMLLDCDRQTGDPAQDAQAFICAQLTELQSVADLAGLSVQLVGVKDGFVRLINSNIASLEQELASATDQNRITYLNRRLGEARTTLAFVQSLSMDVTLAQDGSVSELLVQAPNSLDVSPLKLSKLSLRLRNDQIAFSGNLSVEGIVEAADFARYREEIVSVLRGAEANDPAALNRLKEVASIYISIIVGYTNQ